MKIKNKIIAVISAIVIFLPVLSMFPVTASAVDSSLLTAKEYFLTAGTGDWEGIERNDLESNTSFDKNLVTYPKFSCHLGYDSDKKVFPTLTYDLSSSISRFKLGFSLLYNNEDMNYPYYIYFCGVDNDPYVPDGWVKRPLLVIQVFASMSPIRYDLKGDKYCLASDSDIAYASTSFPTSGYTDNDRKGKTLHTFPYIKLSSRSILTDTNYDFSAFNYSADVTDVKNGKYFYPSYGHSPISITLQEIYSNCDIEINGFNFHNELIKDLKDQIDVKLTPDFGPEMTNDSFTFSITNNSDTPVQYVMYIIDVDSGGFYEYEYVGEDELNLHHLPPEYKYTDDVYDYRISDCMANFEFELDQCKWLYLSDEYYYLFESEVDEIAGFNQDYNLSLSKQYGSSYWHYLGIGKTYTDKIYMQNIPLAQNKNYYFRIRAIPLDPSFECSSILFDPDWMTGDSKTLYYEWHRNSTDIVSKALQLDNHWWTISCDFHLSDALRNVYLDSKNVDFLYNQKFSFIKLPAYTNKIPEDSNSNSSSGFTNDKNNVYDPLYKNNIETGEEIFLKGANASNLESFDISIDSISVENVKEYISFPKQFINLIKDFFTSFPQLWALIIFGLSAIIVIAIVRYLRG